MKENMIRKRRKRINLKGLDLWKRIYELIQIRTEVCKGVRYLQDYFARRNAAECSTEKLLTLKHWGKILEVKRWIEEKYETSGNHTGSILKILRVSAIRARANTRRTDVDKAMTRILTFVQWQSTCNDLIAHFLCNCVNNIIGIV